MAQNKFLNEHPGDMLDLSESFAVVFTWARISLRIEISKQNIIVNLLEIHMDS